MKLLLDDKILITGASGLIGSELVRILYKKGYRRVLTPAHKELNLCDQAATNAYFKHHKPEYVFHLAAYVGGIKSNHNEPARFIYNNTMMQSNVFYACHLYGVKKVLFPGSACAYPRIDDRVIMEDDFLTAKVEKTNESYAYAKINGIIMAQSFYKQYGLNVIIPMVANCYGPNDRSTHVIPDLIRRLKASNDDITICALPTQRREFIHATDAANAFLFLMRHYNKPDIINIGSGDEIKICDLARLIARYVGYTGKITFDASNAAGARRKCLSSRKIKAMGWKTEISIQKFLGTKMR